MISSYAVHDITWLRSNGSDQWGTPNAPTEVALKGFIEYESFLVFNPAGEEVFCSAKVSLADIDISHEDGLVDRKSVV